MKEYGIKLFHIRLCQLILITERRRNLLVNVAATSETILRQGISDPDVVIDGGARVGVELKHLCSSP